MSLMLQHKPVVILNFLLLSVAILAGLTLRYWQSKQFKNLAFGMAYSHSFKPTKRKHSGKWKPSRILKAIYKTAGTGVIAISGKIAGTVFASGGQQGPFIRVWAKPRNRRTALQNLVRGTLSGIASAWRTLTAAQADAWNAAGSGPGVSGYNLRKNVFGDTRKIDGSQLFQRVNNILLSNFGVTLTSPPTTGTTDAIIAMTAAADESAQTVGLTITTFSGSLIVPANTQLEIFATPPKGANQSYFGKSDYRLLTSLAPLTAINPAVIGAAYTTKFGAIAAGQRIGFQVRFIFYDGGSVMSVGGKVYATATVVP